MRSVPRQTKNDGDAHVSRYHITEYPRAFRLDGGSDRIPVTVEQHPHCLAVRYLDPATGQERWDCLGFFEFRTLMQQIIEGLLLGREEHATWHAWTTIQIDWALRTIPWRARPAQATVSGTVVLVVRFGWYDEDDRCVERSLTVKGGAMAKQ